MELEANPAAPHRLETWTPVSSESGHPLAALDGQAIDSGRLKVVLGPTSRFGARYFAVLLTASDGRVSREPVLTGLDHRGPLPSYNWTEVAETNERVTLPGGREAEIGPEGIERVFRLLFDALPAGGHLMVEYDSPARSETARALAHGVPPIATPLGELLFRIGFGAHFKDWQIAEGGSEGPRKLQAYKPPSPVEDRRWRDKAAVDLEAFLSAPSSGSSIVQTARERAVALLPALRS